MAIKASDHFKVFENPNGPRISTLNRPVIQAEGLYFKDEGQAPQRRHADDDRGERVDEGEPCGEQTTEDDHTHQVVQKHLLPHADPAAQSLGTGLIQSKSQR